MELNEFNNNDKYVVLQVVLNEKFSEYGSSVTSLESLQDTINNQASLGYRLHTFTTTSYGSHGYFGGEKIQATMVFEKFE